MTNKTKRNGSPSSGAADREHVLAKLRAAGIPLTLQELAERSNVGARKHDALEVAVQALVRSGDVLVNRKGELLIAEKLDLVRGTVQGHADGFGFLVPDQGGEDLFLSPREMHKILHGDRIAARITGVDRRGRPAVSYTHLTLPTICSV